MSDDAEKHVDALRAEVATLRAFIATLQALPERWRRRSPNMGKAMIGCADDLDAILVAAARSPEPEARARSALPEARSPRAERATCPIKYPWSKNSRGDEIRCYLPMGHVGEHAVGPEDPAEHYGGSWDANEELERAVTALQEIEECCGKLRASLEQETEDRRGLDDLGDFRESNVREILDEIEDLCEAGRLPIKGEWP